MDIVRRKLMKVTIILGLERHSWVQYDPDHLLTNTVMAREFYGSVDYDLVFDV